MSTYGGIGIEKRAENVEGAAAGLTRLLATRAACLLYEIGEKRGLRRDKVFQEQADDRDEMPAQAKKIENNRLRC